MQHRFPLLRVEDFEVGRDGIGHSTLF
jgi:hypothetical protein